MLQGLPPFFPLRFRLVTHLTHLQENDEQVVVWSTLGLLCLNRLLLLFAMMIWCMYQLLASNRSLCRRVFGRYYGKSFCCLGKMMICMVVDIVHTIVRCRTIPFWASVGMKSYLSFLRKLWKTPIPYGGAGLNPITWRIPTLGTICMRRYMWACERCCLNGFALLLCTGLEGIIQNYKADNSSEFEDWRVSVKWYGVCGVIWHIVSISNFGSAVAVW